SDLFALTIVLLVAVPAIAFALPLDRTMAPATGIYALSLSAMAAAAWTSRFSRKLVGVGALLFVASDLVIFVWLGGLLQDHVEMLLNWPLYYTGQLLICLGVARQLARSGSSTSPVASRTTGP
ncbi:MAG: lysoplasmalogenase family protein, partial [Novosphingobium sp.]